MLSSLEARSTPPLFHLSRRVSRAEILIWCTLALAIGVATTRLVPKMDDDSYQYISGADNLTHGNGFSTSIIHFDTERTYGRIPAPLTTFPPGYSLAIASLTYFKIGFETAGFIVALGSLVALVPLICCAARILELPNYATRLALLLFLVNGTTVYQSTAVLSESLFTTLTFAALSLITAHLHGAGRTRHLAIALAILGVATWIRYAGLFLVLAVGTFLVVRMVLRRDRRSAADLLWMGVPAVMLVVLFTRNAVLCGSWKGGNTKVTRLGMMVGISKIATGVWHLLLGDARFGTLHVVFLVAISLATAIALGVTLSSRRIPIGIASDAALPGFCFGFYCACMLYMGTHSVITVGRRMFYPFLPWILLLGSALLFWCTHHTKHAALRSAFVAIILAGFVSYVTLNAGDIVSQQRPNPDRVVIALFAGTSSASSLLQWFYSHVPDQSVIVAEEGQATGYALRRHTISLVGSRFSDEHWEELEVRHVMEAYGAEYLIIYPGLDPSIDYVPEESGFLTRLGHGREPEWLHIAARSSLVKIYRRTPSKY
jgi:hypothetical protein